MPDDNAVFESPRAMTAAPEPMFRLVMRGYDREAVDAPGSRSWRRSCRRAPRRSAPPSGAVRRALDQVGDEVAGILQRAHDTAAQITADVAAGDRRRLQVARREARGRCGRRPERASHELDADTDRIWAERHRIVDDARDLARHSWPLRKRPPSGSRAEEPRRRRRLARASGRSLPAPFDADSDLGPDLLDREFTAEDPLEAPAEAQPSCAQGAGSHRAWAGSVALRSRSPPRRSSGRAERPRETRCCRRQPPHSGLRTRRAA